MSGKDASEEKTLPPSAKRLREARKKGQIFHSKEAITAAVTATAFGYLLIRFLPLFAQLSDGLRAVPGLYDQPFSVAVTILFHRLGADVAVAVAPLVGLLAIVAILGNIVVNGGIVIAIDPILPKIERLDPIAGLKRLLGMKNVIELVKSIFKVGAVSILTCIIISGALQALVEIPTCGLRCAAPIFGALLTPLLLTSVGLLLLLGGLDIGLQRWLFRREMRMTKSEQKRERKESDGDPMIRQHRLRGHRSGSGAKAGLRNATFIVRSADTVLAMRYAAPDAMVPILVARGAQESAFKLLDEAKALNLPVVFDAEAVALIASRLKVGKMITADMFQPIIGCMNEAGII
jgi:type III secretion protein U